MPAPQVIIRLKTGVKRDGTLDGARGRDDPRVRRVLRRRARGERASSSPASTSGRRSRSRGFEVLTHKPSIAAYRAPGGARRPSSPSTRTWSRSPASSGSTPSSSALRHLMREGDPMANGQPWQSNGAKQVLARLAEHPLWKNRDGVGGERQQGRPRAARHRARARRLARRAPADGRHGAAQSRRLAQRAHRPGRHRGHQHRAGPDRRLGLRRRHRQGAHHHRRHRRGAA